MAGEPGAAPPQTDEAPEKILALSTMATQISAMGDRLRARYLKALELTRASLGDVADATSEHLRTLQARRRREIQVLPAAARKLARYLRRRARSFTTTAKALDAAADREERGR